MGVKYKVVKQSDGSERVDELHTIVVHKFTMGDVEDPELYAAQPIYEWQQSEAGKFVMEHCAETPVYQSQIDMMTMGYTYVIIAELEKKKLSEFYLKFDKPKV